MHVAVKVIVDDELTRLSHTLANNSLGCLWHFESVNHGSFPVKSCQTGQRPHKATRNGCCLATGPSRGGPPASSSAMGQKASMRSTPKKGPLQTIRLRQPEEHFDYITTRPSKLQTPEAGGGLGLRKLKREGLRVQRGVRGMNGLGGILVQSRA